MQPPHGADLSRDGVVVLHKINLDPVSGQCLAVLAFAEEPTGVAETAGLQQQHTGQGGLGDVQEGPSCALDEVHLI